MLLVYFIRKGRMKMEKKVVGFINSIRICFFGFALQNVDNVRDNILYGYCRIWVLISCLIGKKIVFRSFFLRMAREWKFGEIFILLKKKNFESPGIFTFAEPIYLIKQWTIKNYWKILILRITSWPGK